MKSKHHSILVLPLFIGMVVTAQLSNFGDLSIFPDAQMTVVGDFNNTAAGSVMNDGELMLHSNFNNDGWFSFADSKNNGLTRFEGTTVQQLSGNQLIEFYNVQFNNESFGNAFELSGAINIVNLAEFSNGIIKNDHFGGCIAFDQLAYHSKTSNRSHVDGIVYKNGDVGFAFPIGDNQLYREATIATPDVENNTISCKYFLKNSNALYAHKKVNGIIEIIDDTEYWMISNEQHSSEIMVTLSWNSDTTPKEIIADPVSMIHIVSWDKQKGHWIDEGGTINRANQTVTTITNIKGNNIFTLARVKEETTLPGDVVVHNAISPNDDTQNNFFFIDGIANFPNNAVQIYNRWGTKVYETRGYNETDNVFTGYAASPHEIAKNEKLPTGTYFYLFNYEYKEGVQSRMVKKTGYLYINNE